MDPAPLFGTSISPLSLVLSQVLPALHPFSPQLGHLCHDSFKRVHSMFHFVEVCECICASILRRLCCMACVQWINISAHTQTRSSPVALRRNSRSNVVRTVAVRSTIDETRYPAGCRMCPVGITAQVFDAFFGNRLYQEQCASNTCDKDKKGTGMDAKEGRAHLASS